MEDGSGKSSRSCGVSFTGTINLNECFGVSDNPDSTENAGDKSLIVWSCCVKEISPSNAEVDEFVSGARDAEALIEFSRDSLSC